MFTTSPLDMSHQRNLSLKTLEKKDWFTVNLSSKFLHNILNYSSPFCRTTGRLSKPGWTLSFCGQLFRPKTSIDIRKRLVPKLKMQIEEITPHCLTRRHAKDISYVVFPFIYFQYLKYYKIYVECGFQVLPFHASFLI